MRSQLLAMTFGLLSAAAPAAVPSKKPTSSSSFGIELAAGGFLVSPVRGVFSISDSFDFVVSLPTVISSDREAPSSTIPNAPTSVQLFSMPIELRYEMPLPGQDNTNMLIGNTLYTYYLTSPNNNTAAGYGLNVGLTKALSKTSKVFIAANVLSYHGDMLRYNYVWTGMTSGIVGYQIKL